LWVSPPDVAENPRNPIEIPTLVDGSMLDVDV
jgi:hypothetical protein